MESPVPGRWCCTHGRCRGSRGVALLEVLVALALLAGSLLVVGGVMVTAARVADTSRDITLATVLAAQKIRQLQALARGMGPDGAEVDDFQSDVADWPNRPAGGTGLGLSPPNTLNDNTAGFVDYLDVAGRWVGSGHSPPPAAAFARRWAIAPAHGAAPFTILLTVRVYRRPPSWAVTAADPGWLPMVHLEAAKTRRGG